MSTITTAMATHTYHVALVGDNLVFYSLDTRAVRDYVPECVERVLAVAPDAKMVTIREESDGTVCDRFSAPRKHCD